MMEQWQRYQDERNPIAPSLRKYNVNDYVCFVCHVKTYRKRIRALRVMVSGYCTLVLCGHSHSNSTNYVKVASSAAGNL